LIFGNNLLGYDPSTYEQSAKKTGSYYGFTDYGAGIWDPLNKQPVKAVLKLARQSGISAARFPGGCGAHHYDWKKSIGERKHFLFGLDEFLRTCQELEVEPLITVSFFTGDEIDAADLVEYLNAKNDGSNPGKGIDWALERAKNGHPLPYNVKYFEIGNEVWHGDHRKIKKVTPEVYAVRYLKYFRKMKSVDDSIQVGAILAEAQWNKKILSEIKAELDFAVMHLYPTPAWGARLSGYPAKELFRISLALPVYEVEKEISKAGLDLENYCGRNVPVAVTEYNGGFVQDYPTPYRFTLGSALLNAELLRIFMQPDSRIFMANYWNFVNEYWGMFANGFKGDQRSLDNQYYARPAALLFKLYQEHFGDILVTAEVKSRGYSYLSEEIPYLSVNAGISENKNKAYLMVINKDLDEETTARVSFKGIKNIKKVNAWILNADKVDATNEEDHGRVKVIEKAVNYSEGKDNGGFEFIFQPHSLTAIEVEFTK
jgi:alpha-N-arabinofuranosidase